MGRHLSPPYSQVRLVSGYLVLTAVNWSQHWCPICVSVFLCSDPKLARKYETEHWSRSSKIINWSADSFQIRHPSLPFDSLPYPTRTIRRRVRTYVRSVNHVTTKLKEVDHNLWVWCSVPRALRARWSPAISGIPYIKLKLGPNSWYTRPTLFVWWGEGLDLCELENISDMQKCPKTFVNDCSLLNNPGHLRTGEPVFTCFETVAFRL